MRVIRFHGPANDRDRVKHLLRGDHTFDLMITTYEAYVADDQWFKTHRWTYCVLDEGHKIKNSDTLLSTKIQGLGSLHRLRTSFLLSVQPAKPDDNLVLTGTPVQNNLIELWGLLHWLLPSVFTASSQSLFRDSFDMTRGSYAMPFLSAAKKLASIIMLRRTKTNVAGDDVPPREELTVFIPLTETQRFWTYRLLTKMEAPDLKKIFADTVAPQPEIKVETNVKLEDTSDVLKKTALSHTDDNAKTVQVEGTRMCRSVYMLMLQEVDADDDLRVEEVDELAHAVAQNL